MPACCLFGVTGRIPVLRQQRRDLACIGAGVFHRPGHLRVQCTPAIPQQRCLCHRLGQRMLELILNVWIQRALLNEFGIAQPCQRRFEVSLGDGRYGGKQQQRKILADH